MGGTYITDARDDDGCQKSFVILCMYVWVRVDGTRTRTEVVVNDRRSVRRRLTWMYERRRDETIVVLEREARDWTDAMDGTRRVR